MLRMISYIPSMPPLSRLFYSLQKYIIVYSLHGNPPLYEHHSNVTSSPPGMSLGLLLYISRSTPPPVRQSYPESTSQSSFISTRTLQPFLLEPPQNVMHAFFLLCQVITPPPLAAGWSADHNNMAAFTGRWPQWCTTLHYTTLIWQRISYKFAKTLACVYFASSQYDIYTNIEANLDHREA
jgi:hypothetical protein